MSSTITAETLARQGDSNEQAAYLRHFRADSIGKSEDYIAVYSMYFALIRHVSEGL